MFFKLSFAVWCQSCLQVSLSMAGLQAADSVSHALQVQQWDGEVRQESKYAAELKQLDNGVKIPPRYTRANVVDTFDMYC